MTRNPTTPPPPPARRRGPTPVLGLLRSSKSLAADAARKVPGSQPWGREPSFLTNSRGAQVVHVCDARAVGWKVLAFCLLTLAAVIMLHPATVQAQGPAGENDHVDVALTLEIPVTGRTNRDVDIIVANNGSRTAYDVEVLVDIVYPANSSFWPKLALKVPVGTAVLEGTLTPGSVGTRDGGGYTFRWNIPELGGLEHARHRIRTQTLNYPVGDPSNEIFNTKKDPHEIFGKVTTSSFESELHKGNNTYRVWFTVVDKSNYNAEPAKGDYSVDSVSVDDYHPAPGDIVNFTFLADTADNGTKRHNIDLKVTIDLTDGLTIDEDPNASPPREISYVLSPTTAPAVSYSNGVFDIGTRDIDDLLWSYSATLPIRVASDAVVNEQCITVTISGNPPQASAAWTTTFPTTRRNCAWGTSHQRGS